MSKRRERGDMMVRNFEARHELPRGSIRNPETGRAVRGDCTLFALRARREEEDMTLAERKKSIRTR